MQTKIKPFAHSVAFDKHAASDRNERHCLKVNEIMFVTAVEQQLQNVGSKDSVLN